MNADKWVQPTPFTGNWPDWSGYTWLDWDPNNKVYHPGDDYNFGWGDQDCGQNVNACAAGVVVHTSKKSTGYGNLIIIRHTLGYNLKRFVKQTYGIETDSLYSLYSHLSDILVAPTNKIDAGSLIAKVGKTGTKLCHLHHEIYSLWKDLKHTNYRFYPVGWSKEKVKENWLPPYSFIEATKQIDNFESFLGKPKAYWLQVEEDRKDLMAREGNLHREFLKIEQGIKEQLEKCQTKNQQLKTESATCKKSLKKTDSTYQKKITEKDNEIGKRDTKIKDLKKRITEILKEQSDKLKIGEAVLILVEIIKKRLSGEKPKKTNEMYLSYKNGS